MTFQLYTSSPDFNMRRTILITGASTGIGAATACHLAQGNTLILHHNQSPIEPVAEEVRRLGGVVHTSQVDLMDQTGCHSLMQDVASKTEHLDVFVNNAGGLLKRHVVEEVTWNLMERIFSLNTYSAILLTKLCVPFLRKGSSPSIVNMTSIAMRHGAPTATVYGAAKGAMDSFTRGAARELAPEIRVNAVAPGVILTPFHDRYSTEEKLTNIAGETPVGFNGESNHIAQAIQLLIENTFITGETSDVNGGLFTR